MITSTGNERIRAVGALTRRAKERRSRDAFVVEGLKMFLEAPPELVREAYVTQDFLDSHGAKLPEAVRQRFYQGGNYEIVSEKAFAVMSDTQTPQGILCVVQQPHWQMSDLFGAPGKGEALIMVLEDLQDPGNLGTIVRTAEGAGVTGILLSAHTVDLFSPKVTRSTMGSIYRVPFVYTDDLQGSIRTLAERGVKICAAHLQGRCSYDQEDYKCAAAFLIGNESRGLTEQTAAMADARIRIPMMGRVESLNAAVAASILMYEAARQRR